jgi:hypothetical protein
MPTNAKLDALRLQISEAGDKGLALAKMKLGGASGADKKAAAAELRDLLGALTRDGSIRGPFKSGASQIYFSAGHGPNVDRVCDLVERLVRDAGVKLPSKKALDDKVKGLNKRYFPDALKQATSKRAILEVIRGSSKFYLHRDVAAERFGWERGNPSGAQQEPATERPLSFEDLLPVYRRLKAEQGGFKAINISDVVKALKAPQTDVHRLIAEEAKAGRVTVHGANSVDLPDEVMAAALRLPGHAEAFVTVAVKEDR